MSRKTKLKDRVLFSVLEGAKKGMPINNELLEYLSKEVEGINLEEEVQRIENKTSGLSFRKRLLVQIKWVYEKAAAAGKEES